MDSGDESEDEPMSTEMLEDIRDSSQSHSIVNSRVFVKLDVIYTDNFLEYEKYFGRALRLLKSMYGMTNYMNLFSDELI